MLFNSVEFLLFLPTVLVAYWHMSRRAQNGLLFIASYVFYGWWDWRFLALIFLSSMVDFHVAQRIAATTVRLSRMRWLLLSLATNLGALGYFKYARFFVQSAGEALSTLGFHVDPPVLSIVLPVGISFYTFQTLSYTLDVHRGDLEPRRDLLSFLAFVSFFPQLVAGPIERASNLLPQFEKRRQFDPSEADDGLRQIVWGFVKKSVIADNLAPVVNAAYGDPDASGSMLLVATFFFAFQIYCDFSGYSDIAIGTAKLFGFRLIDNFRYPYFAANITEFWRRWHISLSTWFRDYVYVPLGGSRHGPRRRVAAVMATFLVSGLWHGANWTFVVWGALHALYYLIELLVVRRFGKPESSRKWWHSWASTAVTFVGVTIAWVFFRAPSVSAALDILHRIAVDVPTFVLPEGQGRRLVLVGLFLLAEASQRKHPHPLLLPKVEPRLRWAAVYLALLVVIVFGRFAHEPFIYFQF